MLDPIIFSQHELHAERSYGESLTITNSWCKACGFATGWMQNGYGSNSGYGCETSPPATLLSMQVEYTNAIKRFVRISSLKRRSNPVVGHIALCRRSLQIALATVRLHPNLDIRIFAQAHQSPNRKSTKFESWRNTPRIYVLSSRQNTSGALAGVEDSMHKFGSSAWLNPSHHARLVNEKNDIRPEPENRVPLWVRPGAQALKKDPNRCREILRSRRYKGFQRVEFDAPLLLKEDILDVAVIGVESPGRRPKLPVASLSVVWSVCRRLAKRSLIMSTFVVGLHYRYDPEDTSSKLSSSLEIVGIDLHHGSQWFWEDPSQQSERVDPRSKSWNGALSPTRDILSRANRRPFGNDLAEYRIRLDPTIIRRSPPTSISEIGE
ncbi:hypothetical protein BS47DRAFT_1486822 [Hydnum rufescens UP504]|uniref:Uncharacterized protein n=1 Tax=Hydnum rufescens UP504 TaxID=1448309 RepID=A0A9P6DUD7_9AGAM|nr:hypothetical protein BS47DRAFT_1486822 [Hydnum rufescens UP504]